MTQRVIKFPKEDPQKGLVLCPACGRDFECEYDMNVHFSRNHISASFKRSIRSVFKYGGKYLHL